MDDETRAEFGKMTAEFGKVTAGFADFRQLLLQTRGELMDRMDRLQDHVITSHARMDEDVMLSMARVNDEAARLRTTRVDVENIRELTAVLHRRLRALEEEVRQLKPPI